MDYHRLCNAPLGAVELSDLKRQSPSAHRLRRPFRVGDGAHYSFNGDSYPCTVRKVTRSGHQIEVTHDRTRAPGIFEPCDGRRYVFTRRRDGRYRSKGHGTWTLYHGRLHEWVKEF
jgi:hypothetical protein